MMFANHPRDFLSFPLANSGDSPRKKSEEACGGAEDPLTGVRRGDLLKETRAAFFTLLVDQVFRDRPSLIVSVAELWQVRQTALEQFDLES